MRRQKLNRKSTPAEAVVQGRQLSPWLGVILVATLIAYAPAMDGERLWDDEAHITKPELQSSAGLYRIWFEVGATQQYYPLLHSAFWIEHKLWGDSVLGYHLVNVAGHLLAVVLFYLILTRLKIPGAILAAAIFALHPVMVESVAWMSEQKNTLSAVFYLGAVLAYLGFDESRAGSSYWLALALFALGTMTKTVIATLPAAMLVIFWWQRGTLSWKRDIVPLLPFFALGAIGGLLTAYVERRFIGAEGAAFQLSFVQRFLIAGRVVWFYLGSLLWPSNLIFIYPRWNVDPAVWWQWLFPAAAIGMTIGLWMIRKWSRAPLAAWLFFCGTLFPALGFLNVYPFVFSFVADHFQYLASLGIIALVSAASTRLAPRLQYAAVAVLCGLTVLSFQQSRMYANKHALYETTIAQNTDCWLAELNLGTLLDSEGHPAEGMEHFYRALAINPDWSDTHSNIGIRLCQSGNLVEGLPHLKRAVELLPGSAPTRLDYGNGLVLSKRYDEAVTECQEAVRLTPNSAFARYSFGIALSRAGRIDPAIAQLRAALLIQPDYPAAAEALTRAMKRAARDKQ